ncbi:aldehyde dehydrogenase family protein [Chitinophaga sedimenti]|uniref:aldehyde dehydrogenase family protein n=1 Tax=Chitinophaga sedimenti TaxID=2033606 RepID=UPI00249F84BA|nr:aldehyde dehydrogenase family protein [Chitinophaga sedimenti]
MAEISASAKKSDKIVPKNDGFARPSFKDRYDNFIGGKWTGPAGGKYFDVVSPIDGKVFTKVAHSGKEDIALAVDAAAEAFKTWKHTSATERSIILNKVADRLEENLQKLATVETIDNGKAIRETLNADLPLAIDHFRYFAGVIRAEEGGATELDKDTVSLVIQEPRVSLGKSFPGTSRS